MIKDEEINQQLDDIRHILKKQDSVLFGIGLMVVGIGGMTIGIIGLIIVGII